MFIPKFEKLAVNTPADTIILDVRSPGEFIKDGIVPGAMTIPLDTLDKRWPEVPRDKTIVTMCKAGNRALQAYRLLKNNGFENVRWVDGHISKYSKGTLQKGLYGN